MRHSTPPTQRSVHGTVQIPKKAAVDGVAVCGGHHVAWAEHRQPASSLKQVLLCCTREQLYLAPSPAACMRQASRTAGPSPHALAHLDLSLVFPCPSLCKHAWHVHSWPPRSLPQSADPAMHAPGELGTRLIVPVTLRLM